MKLFVGLGNPGAKYAGNRHNIGFMALDRIAEDHGFTAWKKAYQGQICEGRLGSEKVLLLKPETFMNLSGQSVRAAADFYKLGVEAITVFHDELDLAPGKLRVKQAGGHAGHNGLRSIHAHMGEAYGRVRIGIGHPGHKDAVAHYVLHDFTKADQDWLEDMLRGISEGAPALAAGDAARFMNAVALRTAPPRSSNSSSNGSSDRSSNGNAAVKSGGKEGAKPKPQNANSEQAAASSAKASDSAPQPDERSAMQRLIDRFR